MKTVDAASPLVVDKLAHGELDEAWQQVARMFVSWLRRWLKLSGRGCPNKRASLSLANKRFVLVSNY